MQNIAVKRIILLAFATVFLASGSLMAQAGFGFRAGASADPDQFHFGVHFVSDPLVPNLSFRPNLELGVGSSRTTIAANLEFAYRIPIPKTSFAPYIGAGPALNVYRFKGGGSDTGGGFNVLLGLEHKNGLFGEVKVGAIDSPEFKFTIGFTVR
jgi:hypothetical protein